MCSNDRLNDPLREFESFDIPLSPNVESSQFPGLLNRLTSGIRITTALYHQGTTLASMKEFSETEQNLALLEPLFIIDSSWL